MTPNFALSLSFEGIKLLHRVTGGWHLVGEVAIDDPELSDKMGMLRRTALALDPQGLRSKILLPNEQIKYLPIDNPRASEDEIIDLLKDATPYAIDDLVYDFSRGGGRTYVAAVAKETLGEAEAFARDFKFNPVCFTSVPDAFTYVGEPFFGQTEAAASILAPGETLERDAEPVKVTGTVEVQLPTEANDDPAPASNDDPEPEAVAPTPEPEPVETEPDPAPASEVTEPEPEPDQAQETSEAEPQTDTEATPEEQVPDAPEPVVEDEVTDAEAAEAEDTDADEPQPVMPVFTSTARTVQPTPTPTIVAKAEESVVATPRLELPTDPEPAAPAIVRTPVPAAPPVAEGKPDPEPKERGLFRTRRRKTIRDEAPQPEQPDTEVERMTVFGARKKGAARRPKYLALILTAILLLFLAGVALWAALTDQTVAQVLRLAPPTQSEIIVAEPIIDDSAAVPTDAEEIEDDLAEIAELDASLTAPEPEAIEAPIDEATPEAEPEIVADIPEFVSQPVILTPAEAQARYDQTGVWQRAPTLPFLPRGENADDIKIAAIDLVTRSADAVALPSERAMLPDLLYPTPILPLAPGSTLSLDDNGFVAATPEGTVTPYGTVVILGAPDVRPPLRPDATEVTPDDVPATPEDTALSPELAAIAAIRPQARPNDVLEQIERQTLGGYTREELAAIRPRLRPEDLVPPEIDLTDVAAIADAVTAANAGVLTASLRPELRPADVPTRSAAAQTASASTAGVVSAPATTRPSGPVPGGVAANATEENVIPLRQMSLLGVAGSSSDRRALIRLRNGNVITVRVGDSLDGGQVTSISSDAVNYIKRGTTYGIEMPRG